MSNTSPILCTGQRWISDSEPELGLGTITEVDGQMVAVEFPASGVVRRYARRSAPLRRVRFQTGDHIGEAEVKSVREEGGLLVYETAAGWLPEGELPSGMSFSRPEDRLRGGRVDDDDAFKLRLEALLRRGKMRQSPVRGFAGARVDLLPHQMSIAAEVAGRLAPRVLLADEVGLGKTIEAALILHRLHLTGRASRVLILVPEALVHQWFIELLRRFHLKFSIVDESRCEESEGNVFLDSQLVLCSQEWLAASEEHSAAAVEAGWELLIVDEAHHLEWAPGAPGAAYALVERLAGRVPGVLLLTATPQQLGPEGHYARLRLLDAERYPSLEGFVEESAHYEEVAEVLRRLEGGKALRKADRALFAGRSALLQSLCDAAEGGDAAARGAFASAVLDAFGPGRVMFRNSRRALKGFPQRKLHMESMDEGGEMKWLAGLLRKLPEAKVLVISGSQVRAEALHAGLLEEIQVDAALFHEGLTLLQRDRNAAWFAADDGARVLICSEIGSEGRNFQFAHHLVLFDLPENPELLEQRIGRLDRIGQSATIHIHVPCVPGSRGEVLARWYHEGMNAFEKTAHGAAEIAAGVRGELLEVLAAADGKNAAKGSKGKPAKAPSPSSPDSYSSLIEKTKALRATLEKRLARGYDLLLEKNACRPALAESIIGPIREADGDGKFEAFVVRLLDRAGVQIEDHSPRSYVLRPGDLQTDALPEITEEGHSVTFDRSRAISREDLTFLTADHPIVLAAMDWLLGNELGNAAYVTWAAGDAPALLLEAVFVLECIAPPALHADRFLASPVVRVVVDHHLADQTADRGLLKAKTEPGEAHAIGSPGTIRDQVLPSMLEKARALAARRAQTLAENARKLAAEKLEAEIARLTALGELNDHVSTTDIAALRNELAALDAAIAGAQLRLDAVRLVQKV